MALTTEKRVLTDPEHTVYYASHFCCLLFSAVRYVLRDFTFVSAAVDSETWPSHRGRPKLCENRD
jgi:hypothetical protein